MPRLRLLCAALAGLALIGQNASAQISQSGFTPIPATPSDSNGLPLNQWVVEYSTTAAATYIDGSVTSDQHSALSLRDGTIAGPSQATQALGSKSASGSASAHATSIGAAAGTADPLYPDSTLSFAEGYSLVKYTAILGSGVPVTMDLHLTGTLAVTGDRGLVTDPSQAFVAVSALGSLDNSRSDGVADPYGDLYRNVGLDPYVEDLALLEQFAAYPTTTQRNLVTFGDQVAAGDPFAPRTIDTTFSVTADGYRFNCDVGTAPECGSYYFTFVVLLFTGAENGAIADFSHTLHVDAIHTGNGPATAFDPATMLAPVPEPGQTALMLAGLGCVGLLGTRRRKA